MDEHRRDDANDTPDAPPAEPASRADDYVDIFLSPAEVFERRRDGRFGQALIILLVLSIAVYYLLLPAAEAMADAQIAETMIENPEAAEAMQGMGGTMRIIGGLFVPIGVALAVLIIGAVLKLLAAGFKIALTFKQALVIATFAGFVGLLQHIAASVSIMLSERDGTVDFPQDMMFGPGRFVEVSDTALAMLAALDLFSLWQAALWGIGFYVIGRAGKGEAVAAAAITLVISIVPGVAAAAFF